MRSFIRRTPTWLAVAAAVAMLVGPVGGAAADDDDDPMNVYFRDEDLEALSHPRLAIYPDIDPGDSEIFFPGFPGAPPQIPHSVKDMLPIKTGENACLDCHLPENADVDGGDVPLPESHFTDPVVKTGGDDAMQTIVTGYEKGDEMSGARFACMLCHAPQANNVDTPLNSFDEE